VPFNNHLKSHEDLITPSHFIFTLHALHFMLQIDKESEVIFYADETYYGESISGYG